VHLHRLDGKKWAHDREKAGAAVADLAAALLETQARRELVPGYRYDIDCDGKEAFYAAFPYDETPDQLAAIAAVEKDMASTKPMDRLVCGDAGYGKTEVAMRAAYIAAMNGKQVAVLAPTTVLAEQHFETFTSRFDGTPIRIESMSRFQSAATHDGTLKRLASGVCDIVIATHSLLTPRVAFHDLGLIVVDEEQRFGVRHKEFLKRIRATADVLTMSATPIPRTLYLAMTGARDLSVLRTPPRERVEVETTVVRDSNVVVRAAVDAELSRGGQVFFLHNRIATIAKAKKRLEEACPKARIVVAHGRMDAASLARKMSDFERGKYDILLSTTIVEAGIDIPRANTIIVDQAHTFGLADLYQLRGRVGRSSRRGHAVFLLPSEGIVDSDARERLSALKRHGGLGGGFGLAVRDLELRGAGNLLGAQQSGHIAAIGFSLYCQLLKRTIAAMKGEKAARIVDVRLNLDFVEMSPSSCDGAASAALPYTYVEEDSQRMAFLKRFAECASPGDVKAVASELEDRFGPMPPAAKRLARLAALRSQCAAAGIDRVDVRGERAVFYREGEDAPAFVADLRAKDADGKIAELAAGLEPVCRKKG
jgi:transcription-repair coupling factor (superfamily II helicase)